MSEQVKGGTMEKVEFHEGKAAKAPLVLVVDDGGKVGSGLVAELSQRGIPVLKSVSISDALDALRKLSSDEVLTGAAIDTAKQTVLSYRAAKERALEAFEDRYFTALLGRTSGNVSEAARQAGLDRSNFRRALRRAKMRSSSNADSPGVTTPDMGAPRPIVRAIGASSGHSEGAPSSRESTDSDCAVSERFAIR